MSRENERIHLERFKEICKSFPEGRIEKSESPDFIVHAPRKLIGIEHTELFQPSSSAANPLQEQDTLARRIVEAARTEFLQRNDQALHVVISFAPRVRLRKKEVAGTAQTISALVAESLSILGSDIFSEVTVKCNSENADRFPSQVRLIEIRRQSKDHNWFCNCAGWVVEITPEQLQETICKKEQKLASYRARCSDVWLLIVADNARIPSTVDLEESAISYRYATDFNRVFFFWNSPPRFVELQRLATDRSNEVTG